MQQPEISIHPLIGRLPFNFFCVFDGKFNTFRSHITICRICFCHLVFLSYDKTLDDMCFLFGYPFIHRISILICGLQFDQGVFRNGRKLRDVKINCPLALCYRSSRNLNKDGFYRFRVALMCLYNRVIGEKPVTHGTTPPFPPSAAARERLSKSIVCPWAENR